MNRLDLASLVDRSKQGWIKESELRLVVDILDSGEQSADTYRLVYVVARSGARKYEKTVARFLDYDKDPMVARLALQTLCTFWGLTGRYKEAVNRFLKGVDWDFMGEVRQVAITAAGDYLVGSRQFEMLSEIIRLASPDNEDEVERQVAVESIARALGMPLDVVLSGELAGESWDSWAESVVADGRRRLGEERV